jgi:hypothetical protein
MSQQFCDVFIVNYIIAISNFHKKASNIALYNILFKKSHKKLCGPVFSVPSNKRQRQLKQMHLHHVYILITT